jgi:hypothetical protein
VSVPFRPPGKISLWAAGLLYAFRIGEPHPHLGILWTSSSRDASVTITSRRHAGFAHRKWSPGLNRIDAPKARRKDTHLHRMPRRVCIDYFDLLLKSGERFEVQAILQSECAGQDAADERP